MYGCPNGSFEFSVISYGKMQMNFLASPVHTVGLPDGASGQESTCSSRNERDASWIPGLGRSPGEGKGSSILAWRIPWTVYDVPKSWTCLSDFHFHFECLVNCISLLVFYFFYQLYLIVVVDLPTFT